MKNVNNYRFQKQQQAKQQHQKVKKIKEKHKKTPVNVTEELDYIKKLLNGEDVEDFVPEKVEYNGMSNVERWSSQPNPPIWINDPSRVTNLTSHMTLSEYIKHMSGEGYYK